MGVRGGGPAVGALTGEHRRGWGRVYGLLMRGEGRGFRLGAGLPVGGGTSGWGRVTGDAVGGLGGISEAGLSGLGEGLPV